MRVNSENLEKAIKAALEGPEERGLRIADYRFNVKPAEITRNGSTITVVGGEDSYISRRRRGRPNDRIYYEFEKTGDESLELSDIDIEVNRGGIAAILPRYAEAIREALDDLRIPPIPPTEYPDPRFSGRADAVAQRVASAKLERLLDGSWECESAFLVANIALRAK